MLYIDRQASQSITTQLYRGKSRSLIKPPNLGEDQTNERGLKYLSLPSEQQLEFHDRHPERAPLFLSSNGLEGMERSREKTDDQPGRPLVDDHSQRREHLGLSGQQQH